MNNSYVNDTNHYHCYKFWQVRPLYLYVHTKKYLHVQRSYQFRKKVFVQCNPLKNSLLSFILIFLIKMYELMYFETNTLNLFKYLKETAELNVNGIYLYNS